MLVLLRTKTPKQESNRFLSCSVKRSDAIAAWSGIRPLVRDPAKIGEGTKALSRSHVVEVCTCYQCCDLLFKYNKCAVCMRVVISGLTYIVATAVATY
jgi:hypothetical protein